MLISGKFYVWGEKAKNAPSVAGVYGLYDENYQLIFVGESSNLRETFAECLETNFSKEPCKLATRYYKRELTPSFGDRKKEILEEYGKKYDGLPRCNVIGREHLVPLKKIASAHKGFYFYEELGKPTCQVAVSLKDFLEKLREVPAVSIEFHQNRGDFAKWIRNVFGAALLADAIERVKGAGEDLRRQLIETVSQPESEVLSSCPGCGALTMPMKTWSMAGRPSKTGTRLKLTIGHYKCSRCGRAFRQVIAKEKIKS